MMKERFCQRLRYLAWYISHIQELPGQIIASEEDEGKKKLYHRTIRAVCLFVLAWSVPLAYVILMSAFGDIIYIAVFVILCLVIAEAFLVLFGNRRAWQHKDEPPKKLYYYGMPLEDDEEEKGDNQ